MLYSCNGISLYANAKLLYLDFFVIFIIFCYAMKSISKL